MISNSEFEKLWVLYKTEGEPKGVSINAFCISRGVKSESMTAEELRNDNRFLIEQLQEAREENRRLREDLSEIRQDLKAANRRADEEAAGRKRLFDKLERFIDDQKSGDDKLKALERKYKTLQDRYELLWSDLLPWP